MKRVWLQVPQIESEIVSKFQIKFCITYDLFCTPRLRVMTGLKKPQLYHYVIQKHRKKVVNVIKQNYLYDSCDIYCILAAKDVSCTEGTAVVVQVKPGTKDKEHADIRKNVYQKVVCKAGLTVLDGVFVSSIMYVCLMCIIVTAMCAIYYVLIFWKTPLCPFVSVASL